MSACRAYFRRLFSNNDVSAIPALPNLDSASFEYFLSLYIMQQCAVALLMMLLYLPYHAELCRQFRKTFLFRSIRKSCVHVSPLIIFAVSGSAQVFCRRTDPLQLFKPHLCMLFLVIRSLQK
jgi:hypothetical protein